MIEENRFILYLFILLLVVLLILKLNHLVTLLLGKEIHLSKYREEINRGYKNIYSHQLVFKNRLFESEKNPEGIVFCGNYIKTNYDSAPYFSYDQEFTIRYRKSVFRGYTVIVIKED